MKSKAESRMQEAEVGQETVALSHHRLFRQVLLPCCLLLSSFILHPSSFAQQTKSAVNASADAPRGPLTYDSFRLLHNRNVFDPDRRPLHPVNSATVAVGHADYVALTGTMIDADKSYAFFSGSRADFNKVLAVRDKIANATITQITPLNIVVERGGKSVNVAVGQTVPLDDKSVPGAAPSTVTEVTATGIDRPPATDSGAAPPGPGLAAAPGASPAVGTAAAPKPGAASPEEIMRKMMERRKQELK